MEWNEDHRGVLAKTQGQCLRVAVSLHYLYWAIQLVATQDFDIDDIGDGPGMQIQAVTMKYAGKIYSFFTLLFSPMLVCV